MPNPTTYHELLRVRNYRRREVDGIDLYVTTQATGAHVLRLHT